MAEYIRRFLKRDRPDEVTQQDLLDFLKQEIEEHQNLEYKDGRVLIDENGKIRTHSDPKKLIGYMELAKDVAGFANAAGGLLILGVSEKAEKYNGVVVRNKPEEIHGIPVSVKREDLEIGIQSKIQFNVDGITIVPIRVKTDEVVYLIDIPQSIRAPHRVGEEYYFQRHNFSTLEMKHYQIADLFGKRLSPDLDVYLAWGPGGNPSEGHFRLLPVLHNKGKSVAKYSTVIFEIIEGSYTVAGSAEYQKIGESLYQWSADYNTVVYPRLPKNTGHIQLQLAGTDYSDHLVIKFSMHAEDMIGRSRMMRINLRMYGREVVEVKIENLQIVSDLNLGL